MQTGAGVYGSSLVNCTVTENFAPSYLQGIGADVSRLTNCIIYGHAGNSNPNYTSSCVLRFCCTTPLPAGTGNITSDPQLAGDGVHISSSSPCRAVGNAAVVVGTDIDGQAWASPPSIGCDEWLPVPVLPYSPQVSFRSTPVALNLGIKVLAGQPPFTFVWQKDGGVLSDGTHYTGTDTTSLIIRTFGPEDIGSYVCIASNSFGMATSPPVQVVIHCVAPGNSSPIAPYSDWATAATNIQDAIDIAGNGDFVLMTNGVYASGGKVVAGDLTNRIVIDKALFVTSVNGSGATTIQGAFVTNGPSAIRCVWLADGAILNGFTVQGGSTRTNGDGFTLQSGGGIWAASTNAAILNCLIQSNKSSYSGGGSEQGFIQNCSIIGNGSGQYGGAADLAFIQNCFITGNSVVWNGGGVSFSTLVNCTVVFNSSSVLAGGAYQGWMVNSILYNNSSPNTLYKNWDFNTPPTTSYSCTTPAISGIGNITNEPLFLNMFHLPLGSPCIGVGTASASYGTDLDGELWATPPSIGCDEFYQTNFTGPISVSVQPRWPAVIQGGFIFITPQITGKYYTIVWSWGDGTSSTNSGSSGIQHRWNSPGTYTVSLTAYNEDYPGGVSASAQIEVLPQVSPSLSGLSLLGTNAGLVFAGQPGASYNLERATNLAMPISWQLVATLNTTNTNSFPVVDTAATSSSGFYRARRTFP